MPKKKKKLLAYNNRIQKACRWAFEDFVEALCSEMSKGSRKKTRAEKEIRDAAERLILREFGEDAGGLIPFD